MKYTPKHLETNHNVSNTHPLAEMTWLLGGVVLLLSLAFLLLSWLADWLIEHTSIETEIRISQQLEFKLEDSHPALQQRFDRLLAHLPADSPLHRYSFRIFLVKEKGTVNAMALPGGIILVYSGLIELVESENELAMVLAHELGHFNHRDHLRSLGRGLSLTLLSALLFGEQSGVTELISTLFLTAQANYSREQEAKADEFALGLLVQRYGHAGGATDFFARMAQQDPNRHDFLASHPASSKRIKAIKEQIATQGFEIKALEPFGQIEQ